MLSVTIRTAPWLALLVFAFACSPAENTGESEFSLANVGQVCGGQTHSCAVLADGSVQCWGRNIRGQLGDGTTNAHYTPRVVPGLTGMSQIACGDDHTCASKQSDGSVWCWGDTSWGQGGDNTGGSPFNPTFHASPTQVWGLFSTVELVAGANHTCARRSDGTVWCWGWGAWGQLGNAGEGIWKTITQVVDMPDAIKLSANNRHTCAVRSDGSAWCWGSNQCGQIGKGSSQWDTPQRVENLPPVADIAAGGDFTCARTSTWGGSVYCWGGNFYGQLADGNTVADCAQFYGIKDVTSRFGGDLTQIALGRQHGVALRADSTIMTWGRNGNGQLGNGQSGNQINGWEVFSANPLGVWSSATAVFAGAFHTCSRQTDGRLMCWGNNAGGQIGNGATGNAQMWPTYVADGAGGNAGPVCGNGVCEGGENGAVCGQDCCDESTDCGQTRQNLGVFYCRNMYQYDWQTGSAHWNGFQWITVDDATAACSQDWQATPGPNQTRYQCAGHQGACVSVPGGYN